MFVLVALSCMTLCDSRDCSLPGSSVCGILQARILKWFAIPFSRGSSWPRDQTYLSRIAVLQADSYHLSFQGSIVWIICKLFTPIKAIRRVCIWTFAYAHKCNSYIYATTWWKIYFCVCFLVKKLKDIIILKNNGVYLLRNKILQKLPFKYLILPHRIFWKLVESNQWSDIVKFSLLLSEKQI